ncbi:MAG: CDP-alcohol phosphatidyltransferase family protein [Verrucomicrobia subdivision 3 bacterium]|nr:CDP-alcohol phosphatidyltransferase family protein [Limisphaerales bacterium]
MNATGTRQHKSWLARWLQIDKFGPFRSDGAVTTANKITILRILLVPFFILQVLYYVQGGNEWYRLFAVLSFAAAAISDGIDGYIARHYRQESELGRILDPLADKMLLVSGVVLLSMKNDPHLGRIPMWLTTTILSRDALLIVGLLIIQHVCGKVTVRPVMIGKAATVLQMACILWTLLKLRADWLFFVSLAAALCTGISGIIYVLEGIRQLSASPSSSATVREG